MGRSKDGPSEDLLRVVRAAQQIANREHASAITAAHIEQACMDEGISPSQLTLREESSAFGVGLSSDAKKEVQGLVDQELIPGSVLTNRAVPSPLSISKPSALMARLLGLFTHANSLVVDVGSPAAELASVAVAAGRRAIHVELPLSQPYRDDLLLPRLRAASRGQHPIPHGILFTEEPLAAEEDRPKSFFIRGKRRDSVPDAGVCVFELGPPLVEVDPEAYTVALDYGAYLTSDSRFLDALASVEGLVPLQSPQGAAFARTFSGVLAAYVPSKVFLDESAVRQVVKDVADLVGSSGRLRIYYHRGQQPSAVDGDVQVEFRMVPFQLQVAAGCL
jgi:hypothetical protein